MSDGFWNDSTKAQNISKELGYYESQLNDINSVISSLKSLKELIILSIDENDNSFEEEILNSIDLFYCCYFWFAASALELYAKILSNLLGHCSKSET